MVNKKQEDVMISALAKVLKERHKISIAKAKKAITNWKNRSRKTWNTFVVNFEKHKDNNFTAINIPIED